MLRRPPISTRTDTLFPTRRSSDLAVTRFSGRPAPLHPGGVPGLPDRVTREAYSHEVSSAGFWPGSDGFPQAAFYSYAYPEPPGFREQPMPEGASFDPALGEFIRSEEHTSELQSLMRISYAVFCLKKKTHTNIH